jgi:hypothetical protein
MIKWELYGKCTAIAAYLHVDVGCSRKILVDKACDEEAVDEFVRSKTAVCCGMFVCAGLFERKMGLYFLNRIFLLALYVDNPARDCSL